MRREVAQTIRSALQALEAETNRYLSGYRIADDPPDPECCAPCRSEHARWLTQQQTRTALERRQQNVNDALAAFGPSLDIQIEATDE